MRLNHTGSLPGEQSVPDKATKVSCTAQADAQHTLCAMHMCDGGRWHITHTTCVTAVARGVRKQQTDTETETENVELATFESSTGCAGLV